MLRQSGYFWCKLYKKDFLDKAFPDSLLFPESVQYEEFAFNTLATIQAGRIEKVDYCFYNYYQNDSSTVRNISTQLDKIEIANYLLQTRFAKNEYRDLIWYKCTVLCGAALLYGILPLYNSQKEKCEECLEELKKITPRFIGGDYQEVPEDMREQLEKNSRYHKLYLLKLKMSRILRKR